eukprot:m.57538 g.57538  ORF g.57538 m.57538 type:complete len:447 (-) comp17103_c0_seq1:74-1414(-)
MVGESVVLPDGPTSQLPDGGASFLEVSTAGIAGSFFMRQQAFNQLWRVPATHGSAVQYCSLGATAPFELAPSTDPAELQICWRGARLPSHASNCTGCGCVEWTLRVDGDTLESTVLMSPPVIPAKYTLARTGPPAKPGVLALWARTQWRDGCAIGGNRTLPDYPRVLPPPPPAPTRLCPFRGSGDGGTVPRQTGRPAVPHVPTQQAAQVQPSDHGGRNDAPLTGCAILNKELAVRFEYAVSALPCTPTCDVTFNFSMPASASEYVAFGFKEQYAAYRDSSGDLAVPEIPDYWGMATASNFSTPLSGRIVAVREGCPPWHLRADAYVGSLVDARDDGFLNVSSTAVAGRTSLVMTARQSVPGATAAAQGAALAAQRVMWAVGPDTQPAARPRRWGTIRAPGQWSGSDFLERPCLVPRERTHWPLDSHRELHGSPNEMKYTLRLYRIQ